MDEHADQVFESEGSSRCKVFLHRHLVFRSVTDGAIEQTERVFDKIGIQIDYLCMRDCFCLAI